MLLNVEIEKNNVNVHYITNGAIDETDLFPIQNRSNNVPVKIIKHIIVHQSRIPG